MEVCVMHLSFKSLNIKAILFAVISALTIPTAAQAANVWAVDSNGSITLNDAVFRIKGGSWFGLEGRYELSTDATNPRGAPMEMYMGNVFWAPSSRTIAEDAIEIKNMGFNCIRLPLVPQTLDDNDPQGKDPVFKKYPVCTYSRRFYSTQGGYQSLFRRRPLCSPRHPLLLQLRGLEKGPLGRTSAMDRRYQGQL